MPVVRRLARDKRGAVAVMTAITMLPLILFAGLAIDLARQVQLYRALQNAADSAALAGATLLSEANYAADIPVLVHSYLVASTSGLNATVTLPAPVVTADLVTVTISGSIPTTLLSMLAPTLLTSATAVAGGPESTITISTTPNGTQAADLNTIYIYAVEADLATRDLTSRTILVNNNSTGVYNNNPAVPLAGGPPRYPANVPVSVTFSLGLGERIAFELDNLTGGRNTTFYNGTTNTYGSASGTTNVFYSSDYPASLHTANATNGYSASHQSAMVNAGHVNFDNAKTACYVYQNNPISLSTYSSGKGTGTIGGAAQQENVLVNGNCANVTPGSADNIDPTCLELNGQTLGINWNDMGDTYADGDSDRYQPPYADMSYSISCTTNAGPYLRVVLTQ